MTFLDLAQQSKGKLRDGISNSQTGTSSSGTAVEYGTAIGDSSNGYVTIRIDNNPTDGSADFSVACDAPISDGDRVTYIQNDSNGKAVSVATVAQIAEDAAETSNYFWHDSAGAHVSDIPNSTAGKNILIDTDSVDIKSGSSVLATFYADGGVAYIKGSNQLFMTSGSSAAPKPVYLIAPYNDEDGYADDRGVGLIYPLNDNSEVRLYGNVDSAQLFLGGTGGTSGQTLVTDGFGNLSWGSGGGGAFDTIYDTPDYYFGSGDINSDIDPGYDPNRTGRPYNELDASITGYDLLIVCFDWGTNSGAQNLTNGQLTMVIPVSSIPYGTSGEISSGQKAYEFRYAYPASSLSWYIDVAFGFLDATHIYAHRRTYSNLPYWNIYKIYGIKF